MNVPFNFSFKSTIFESQYLVLTSRLNVPGNREDYRSEKRNEMHKLKWFHQIELEALKKCLKFVLSLFVYKSHLTKVDRVKHRQMSHIMAMAPVMSLY